MARRKLMLDEATKRIDLSGKNYIVTGANSGVGFETTRQLIKQGGHVIMACRRVDAGKEVAKEFDSLKGSYEVMKLDLANLQSVRDFAGEFLKKYNHLEGLDCNAGAGFFGRQAQYTVDGLEMTMAVSFYGHFLLNEMLLDLLKKSAPSRIVLLSSVVRAGNPNNRPKVHLDDMNYKNRSYGMAAYSEAKVANVLYAKELAERLKGTGVTSYSVHPGWARSNFGRNNALLKVIGPVMNVLIRSNTDSNEESAQTSLHCLMSDDVLKHSGAYFSQSSTLYRDKECVQGGWPLKTPNPHADDMNVAKQLVTQTYGVVGLDK